MFVKWRWAQMRLESPDREVRRVQSSSAGQRLRQARQQRGMSQADLAGSDFSVSYISMIESGKRTPTADTVSLLASRVGATVEYLLTGAESPELDLRRLQLRYGQLALSQGEPSEARTRLMELASSLDDRDESDDFAWEVASALAQAHEAVGDLRSAVVALERLRERAQRDPARWPLIEVSISLSRCYREAGDLRRAVDVAEFTLSQIRQLAPELVALLPRLVSTLAMAYYERGDLTRAQQLLDEALTQADTAGNRLQRGSVLWNSSILASSGGRHADALRLADRALALIAEDADSRSLARLKVTRAWIELGAPGGDVDVAMTLLCAALPALVESGSQVDIADLETDLARAELLRGDATTAIRHARSALYRLGDEPRLERARAHLSLGEGLIAAGEAAKGQVHVSEAGAVLELLDADRKAALVWRQLAEVQLSIGQSERAADTFRRALDASGIPATTGTRWPAGAVSDMTDAVGIVDAPAAAVGLRPLEGGAPGVEPLKNLTATRPRPKAP